LQIVYNGHQYASLTGTVLSQRAVHPSFDCSQVPNLSAANADSRGDLFVPRTRL